MQVLPTYICIKHMLMEKKKKNQDLLAHCNHSILPRLEKWCRLAPRKTLSFLDIQQTRDDEHRALSITPPLTGQLLLVGVAEGEWESREGSLGWLAHAPTTTLGGRQGPSLLLHSCAYLRPYDVSR